MSENLSAPPPSTGLAPIVTSFAGTWPLSIAGSGWYDLDPAGSAASRPSDVVIPGVKAGDTVEYGLSVYSASAANGQYIGVATIVDGAPVTVTRPIGWIISSGAAANLSGSVPIVLGAGDIEDDGSVRLRVQANRITGTTARNFGFSTDPMRFFGRGPFR